MEKCIAQSNYRGAVIAEFSDKDDDPTNTGRKGIFKYRNSLNNGEVIDRFVLHSQLEDRSPRITQSPTQSPTIQPSFTPTNGPTTSQPSSAPTTSPSSSPSLKPSSSPTEPPLISSEVSISLSFGMFCIIIGMIGSTYRYWLSSDNASKVDKWRNDTRASIWSDIVHPYMMNTTSKLAYFLQRWTNRSVAATTKSPEGEVTFSYDAKMLKADKSADSTSSIIESVTSFESNSSNYSNLTSEQVGGGASSSDGGDRSEYVWPYAATATIMGTTTSGIVQSDFGCIRLGVEDEDEEEVIFDDDGQSSSTDSDTWSREG